MTSWPHDDMLQMGNAGYKVIVKHEDHILWVESLVLRNLGPISRLYDVIIRRQIGILFCWLGNSIYQALLIFSQAVCFVLQCMFNAQETQCMAFEDASLGNLSCGCYDKCSECRLYRVRMVD